MREEELRQNNSVPWSRGMLPWWKSAAAVVGPALLHLGCKVSPRKRIDEKFDLKWL